MKTARIANLRNNGSAIVITFMLTFVIAVVVAGAILLVSHEFGFTAISSSRVQALNAAEAGIETALAAYQQQVGVGPAAAWGSWTAGSTPGVYSLAYSALNPSGHNAPASEYTVTVDTGPGVVTASGRLTEPKTGQLMTRTIQVTIATNTWNPWVNAMTGKGIIDLTGTVEIDSFNSQDPNWSTSNQYDSTKSASNAIVATIATNDPGIIATGGGYIDGEFVAGVGGSVDVGGAFTLNGVATNGYEQDIPDVIVPFSTVITDASIGGNQTINVLGGTQDMSVPEIRLLGNSTFTVTGSGVLRIYVAAETYFSGNSQMVITPNPPDADLRVEIYANDDVLLNNVLNQGGYAGDFTIYGTPNCQDVHFTGSDDYAGTIYAPQADIKLAGSGDFFGSIVGNCIHTTGSTGFHWDESLATNKTRMVTGYQIATWREL